MRISLDSEEQPRDGYTYLDEIHKVGPGIFCPVSKTTSAIGGIPGRLHDPHFLFSGPTVVEEP